jgi:DNA replication and repair protein RecF
LSVTDFRNLARLELLPSERATIVVGQNAQGKTNLLEAVYFLATLKPLRAARLGELVRFGTSSAQVSGRFLLKGAERRISVQISDGVRQAFVDEKKAQSLEEYFGGVSVVAFTPDDLEVVKQGPQGRRWFLDRAVFNRFPAFLKESRLYARALKSRNRLLKEGADLSYLEAYDETLSQSGARIWTRRQSLLSELAPRAEQAFAQIVRGTEPARFVYSPSNASLDPVRNEAELAAGLRQILQERTPQDAERGFTSVGPHADDLSIQLGSRAARSYASQGQQRALVLAWKIGEIENLQQTTGLLPLLLLDDVSSELDPERNAYLMSYVSQSGAQVFLTTTSAGLVAPAAGAHAVWCEMKGGALSVLSNIPG